MFNGTYPCCYQGMVIPATISHDAKAADETSRKKAAGEQESHRHAAGEGYVGARGHEGGRGANGTLASFRIRTLSMLSTCVLDYALLMQSIGESKLAASERIAGFWATWLHTRSCGQSLSRTWMNERSHVPGSMVHQDRALGWCAAG